MAKKERCKVFISYSHYHSDAGWAKRFARALEQRNVSVWLDVENIKAGEARIPAIERAFREADLIVLVLSKQNMDRPNVLFEWGAAVGLGKRVVPIIPRDVDPSKMPVALRLRQFLTRDEPAKTADKLVATAFEPMRKAE